MRTLRRFAAATALSLAAAPAAGGGGGAPLLALSTSRTAWSDDHVFAALPGGTPRALASGSAPSVSPDGRQIAFVRAGSLWVMAANGSAANAVAGLAAGNELWPLGNPVWSPDEARVAVPGPGAVAVVDLASGSAVRLLASAAGFSADGTRIAYVAPEGLFVAAADGTASTLVAPGWSDAVGVVWSPDDAWIAFSATPSGGSPLEAVVRPDGTDLRTFSPGGSGYGSIPAWSQDGRLAWKGFGRLWIASPAGPRRTLARLRDLGWPEPAPVWARDGRTIVARTGAGAFALVSVPSGRLRVVRAQAPAALVTSGVSLLGPRLVYAAHAGDGDFELALERLDGTVVRTLTRNTFDDLDPAWSPDGRTIAFVRRGALRQGVYLLSPASGTVRRLTSGADRAPAYAPDGRTIAFVRGQSLMLMDAAGGRVRALGATSVAPRQLSWTPDGAQLVYAGDYHLKRLDLTTGTVTTIEVGGDAFRPAVSPDGKLVAFLGFVDTAYFRDPQAWGIYVVGLDGQGLRKLATGYLAPTSWSPDGKLVTATNGAQLFLVRGDGSSQPTPLGPSPSPFSAGRTNRAAFRP